MSKEVKPTDELSPEAKQVQEEFEDKKEETPEEEPKEPVVEEQKEPEKPKIPDKKEEEVKPEKIEEEPTPDRTPRTVPYSKLKSERKKLKEKDATIKELEDKLAAGGSSKPEVDKSVEEYIKKHGLEDTAESVKDLVDIITSKTGQTSAEVEKKLKILDKQTKQVEENDAVESNINKLITDKSTSEEDKTVIKENKERIVELAFTEGFTNLSVFEIFNRYVKPSIKPKKKGGEISRGGSKQIEGSSYNFDNPSAEEIKAMPTKVFLEFMEHKKKNEGVKIRRGGRTIN